MSILRMRDAGRSWSEISERTGLSVAEAKAEIAPAKRERRSALARSPQTEDARGLNDLCHTLTSGLSLCHHSRREHDQRGCLGCEQRDQERHVCRQFTGREDALETPLSGAWATQLPNDADSRTWRALLTKHQGNRHAAGVEYRASRGGQLSVPRARALSRLRRRLK